MYCSARLHHLYHELSREQRAFGRTHSAAWYRTARSSTARYSTTKDATVACNTRKLEGYRHRLPNGPETDGSELRSFHLVYVKKQTHVQLLLNADGFPFFCRRLPPPNFGIPCRRIMQNIEIVRVFPPQSKKKENILNGSMTKCNPSVPSRVSQRRHRQVYQDILLTVIPVAARVD